MRCKLSKIGCLAAILMVCLGGTSVWGGSYTFNPNSNSNLTSSSSNLLDLDHSKYYAWGMKWTGPELRVAGGEVVQSAVLKIDNIYNWDDNANVMHLWLVDSQPLTQDDWRRNDWPDDDGKIMGVSIGRDGYQDSSDRFTTTNTVGVHLMDYSDSTLGKEPENLEIYLPVDQLQEYISNDGKFGLAFDPDCHYYYSGISLLINTVAYSTDQPVPEPVTGLGVIAAVGALTGYLRKRKTA